ncbi:MAG: hypothetical protein ACYC1L_13715 [Alphaproteobacteria bacterium]
MSGWELLAAAALTATNQISQGVSANKMAKHNASVSEGYATAARDQAAFDESRAREQARRALGARQAAYGGAGITLEGTPIDVMGDAASDAEMDALSLRRRGDLEAWGRLADAGSQRTRGRAALQSGLMDAGSTLLSGASKIKW